MTETSTTPPVEASASQPDPGDRFRFTTAVRQQRPARILLDGPPGAGTLYTSLALATSIGDRVAVIDAQRGRASAYAEKFEFDMCPPLSYCSPDTLVTMLAHCADQRYDTVVVSPLSAFWTASGGVREQVTRASKRSGSSRWSPWDEVRPMERQMLDALLGYPGHVIATVRDKLEYVAGPDENGRVTRHVIGLAPIGREGMEYEWDIVATMDHSHTLIVVKAPNEDLSGRIETKPGARFAADVKSWLDRGEPVPPPFDLADEALQPSLTFEELGDLMTRVRLRQAEGHPLLLPTRQGTTLGVHITQRGNELRRES
ncbi:AAA family ATPase [Streptomyces sp. NPDC047049]|uniref:AAA family ATPase n=1 Tax=Streptomyces sp. NPDC047049 TaxID=3156688 RepID=UPI00340DBC0E